MALHDRFTARSPGPTHTGGDDSNMRDTNMTTILGIAFLIVLFFLFMAIPRERRRGACMGCGVRQSVGLGCGSCHEHE
jgi:hypothetical protein